MYNVRVKEFFDGCVQIQVFSHSVFSAGEKDCKKVERTTGEILQKEKGYLLDVPFEDEPVRVTDMPDLELSAYKSYLRTKKTVYDIARSNRWDWFVTFTFNGKKVNRYNFDDCSKKLSMWLNRMRKRCPDMVYLVVPEQHKDGAFHFHGLFSDCSGLDFVYSGHNDSSGREIYNVGSYRFGFTTATVVTDSQKSASYICKYITKDLCAVSMNRKRYWVSRNALRPIVKDYELEGTEEERLFQILSVYEALSIKKVSSAYLDVTYIESQSMRKI